MKSCQMNEFIYYNSTPIVLGVFGVVKINYKQLILGLVPKNIYIKKLKNNPRNSLQILACNISRSLLYHCLGTWNASVIKKVVELGDIM
jgi:hypothetical protein